jgi:uncharacterized protein YdhG (YjbR/CyaY superfamily)
MRKYQHYKLTPTDEFQRQFRQALVDAGYDTPEKVVDLVQDVKRELLAEKLNPKYLN